MVYATAMDADSTGAVIANDEAHDGNGGDNGNDDGGDNIIVAPTIPCACLPPLSLP